MKSKTLLAVVVFPSIVPYISDYVVSIKKQTYQNFDWLVINDGASEAVKELFPENIIWQSAEKNETPYTIRNKIMDFAFENNYQYLIFSDADDFCSENRIENSVKVLYNFDFVYNEMDIITENNTLITEKYLSKIKVPNITNSIAQILNYNYIGMGNSAIKISETTNCRMAENIIAGDWFLFSLFLLNNAKGAFCENCKTFYRQHENNLVGCKVDLTLESIKKTLRVKTLHYKELEKYCTKKNKYIEKNIFQEKLIEMEVIENHLKSEDKAQKYVELLKTNYENKGWWSNIF